MNIVLASGSPRRKELLGMLGLRFEICPAVGEEKIEAGLAPDEVVRELARAKALEVAARREKDSLVIAADTVVSLDGEILGKPHSEAEAEAMLKKLSGRSHKVYTGLCLVCGDRLLCDAEETSVRFRELSDAETAAYIKTGEPLDKAGAYGIQGKASLFIEGIDGDYYNVVGLPLCKLYGMLKAMGVTLL